MIAPVCGTWDGRPEAAVEFKTETLNMVGWVIDLCINTGGVNTEVHGWVSEIGGDYTVCLPAG